MDCPSTPNGKPESYCLLLTVLPTRLSKQQQEQAVHFLSSVSNKYDEKLKTKAIWDITLLNKASFRKNLKPSLGSSQTQGLTLHGLIMASYKQSYKMLCIPGLKDWKISSSFELFLSENIATIYARDKRYALALMANSLPQINEATRKKLNLKAVSNPEFKNVFKQSLLH